MKKATILLSLVVLFTVSCVKSELETQQVPNVSSTPCKQGILRSSGLSDKVDVEFTNKGVQITHYNFEVSCDFTTVNVTHTFTNGVLNITQKGSPNQADCVCHTDVSYTIEGISQDEVNVIFINGVQVYCYNDKNHKPQVYVSNVTFTECINTALYLPPAIFTVDFTSLGMNITHYLLNVNCAFDTVLVTQTFENGILTITEQGYPNNANCVCKANVSYTIGGISEKDIDKIVINGEVAWTANQQSENLFVGKWLTSDNNSRHNDTIHFTADMRIEDYFIFAHTTMYPASSYYFTYSLTENIIKITSHQPENAEFSETFQYILNGNLLTIKGFSNPFSLTAEARSDVHFTKI